MPPSAANLTQLLVVDDHVAIREALVTVLGSEPDLHVCGTAASGSEALTMVEKLHPEVVTVDMSVDDKHGLDLVQDLRVQYPEVQVVVFSMHAESVYAERALHAGASAYLMKSEPTTAIAEAVRAVARGELYLSHRIASRLLRQYLRPRGFAFEFETHTERERTVFQMLKDGLGVQEIADRLGLSRKNVETYVRRKETLGFGSVH